MSEELFPPHIHASETRPHGPWIGKLLHTFLKQLFWKPPIIDHFQNWSLFWSIHFLYSLWDRLHCHYHAAVAEVSICWCWTTPAPAFCAPHMPEPEYRDGKGMLGWHHGGTTLLSCVWGVHPPMDSLGYFKPWLSYWRPRAKAVCHMSVLSGMGILPVLLNPLQNILPSPGLRPGTRISFLASLHSEELFHLPSFPPRNVLIFLTFLSASLPKIRLLLSLSLTSSTVLYFSISCIIFFFLLFLLCDLFLEKKVSCSECLLMLEKEIGQSTNWTHSCLLYCSLFRNGQLFVLQPNLQIFSKALPLFAFRCGQISPGSACGIWFCSWLRRGKAGCTWAQALPSSSFLQF